MVPVVYLWGLNFPVSLLKPVAWLYMEVTSDQSLVESQVCESKSEQRLRQSVL